MRLASAFRNFGDLCSERKHLLQILTLYWLPSCINVCLWTLALNRVLVCRLEWLTLLPLIPDLRQSSHLIILSRVLLSRYLPSVSLSSNYSPEIHLPTRASIEFDNGRKHLAFFINGAFRLPHHLGQRQCADKPSRDSSWATDLSTHLSFSIPVRVSPAQPWERKVKLRQICICERNGGSLRISRLTLPGQ